MHLSPPFAAQHSARPQVRNTPAQIYGARSRFLGGPRAIEQSLTLAIQVTEMVSLEAVSQNAKQEMSGQVRGRSPPQYGMPTGTKLTDVEITQARNLDGECLPVRHRRTDLNARHVVQGDRPLDG